MKLTLSHLVFLLLYARLQHAKFIAIVSIVSCPSHILESYTARLQKNFQHFPFICVYINIFKSSIKLQFAIRRAKDIFLFKFVECHFELNFYDMTPINASKQFSTHNSICNFPPCLTAVDRFILLFNCWGL